MCHIFDSFKPLFSDAMLYFYFKTVGIFVVKSLVIHSTELMFTSIKFCFMVGVEYT